MPASVSALPVRLNAALAAGIALATLIQMFALPFLLPGHPWLSALVIVLLAPLNTPFWSLIHEAVHKNFHSNRHVNEWAGRLMSVLFGASFDVLRFGHLMHHQYNRHWESEHYAPGKQNAALAYINHYFKMLGGLYLIEAATSFLIAISPLPVARRLAQEALSDVRHQQAVLNALLKPNLIARLRVDCVLIVLIYGLAFYVYGALWPLLVLFIMMRAFFISIMDNAYHYGTPDDNSVIAKELAAPRWMAKFILNFNHHATHHKNTKLPWTQLQDGHAVMGVDYSEGLTSAIAAQFKGPVKKV